MPIEFVLQKLPECILVFLCVGGGVGGGGSIHKQRTTASIRAEDGCMFS